MSVDYPGAVDMSLPLSYSFSSNAHKAIVQHSTGGNMTVQSVYNTFLSTMRSAHFAIGLDGTVAQFVPLSRGAGGNCCPDGSHNPWWDNLISQYTNLNLCTISIEHCNNALQSLTMTPAQMEASNKLTLWLCQQYGLGPGDIWGHDSINATGCPGKMFYDTYWAQMIDYVKNGGSAMAVPQGWKDDGTTLTAPNGNKVITGFRDYVLANNWNPSNVPLQEEGGLNPLEGSNPSLGAGTRQIFEWTILEWTQGRGVFVAWGGRELLWRESVYNLLYAEYQKLKAQQGNPQVLTDAQQMAANVMAMYPIAQKYHA